ncbi:Uncharacterised protein [Legionella pneumophila]|uniref:hypothetical protein n=1 Tax=Legionella pneumophila TaxID=446 RepID=UPI0005C9DEC1|nr:hypothetical protein [Legionella pneumophila]WAI79312.1 hypothetical protein OXA86_00385 [Legionella pneumophila]CZG74284.1 Uncharacterised protein [Legionella pneumophila]CZH98233.1 Uncharacterised protein [Legionella pneumophila]HAT4692800.1 hypothetical protein [Legionella pneumophila]HDO7807764.1 hypothetical protein [Legionella pneumophila]
MSNLTDSIKEYYEDISAGEAQLAADNLVNLFKILEQVDARLAQSKQRHEPKNEDIRSTH